MSLNEPYKIISLSSELNELLQSWNISISTDNQHTQIVKNENVSVCDNSKKELDRATNITETDKTTINISSEKSELLLNKGNELLIQVEPLLSQAETRHKQGKEWVHIWKKHKTDSADWFDIAVKEFKRAEEEYQKSVNDYEKAKEEYNKAVEKAQRCIESQSVNKDGKKTPSCSYEIEKRRSCEQKKREAEEVMKEKERIKDKALQQREMAKEAYNIAQIANSKAQDLFQRSIELLDMGRTALRNTHDAISAAKSAIEFDKQSQELNEKQNNLNNYSNGSNNRVQDAMSNVYAAFNKILDFSESCERFNAQFRSELEAKNNLLYHFSKIQPDTIFIKDNKD